ncbi:serine hydroxymethyltransferase [Candidatus Micrarchaeota archaeon]|nr:serine hydroxymethyltransferase [Candidatus Micrarchaeota archaeon]
MKNESLGLKQIDPEIYGALVSEMDRESEGVELIPSENYVSTAVLQAIGSVFTNKYSEGYPGKRYYGGNQFTDIIETLAIERAKKLFRAMHANVQPLSGSPMNQAVYFAFLKPGDTVLGMDLSHGGHLTHGHPVSHMGKIFNFVRYKTHPEEQGRIDFDELARVAHETKPKIVLCGYTSYPRDYDYRDFKKIAEEVGAITMADVAHIGGLIAADVMRNPFDFGFDIVTTTTHKTLRGPRGGMVLCKQNFASTIDKSVFPGLQGGPHMNTIAGIAVALHEAGQPAFKEYATQALKNAKALAKVLMDNGAKLITDGTDNHMMVVDTVTSFGLSGKESETTLDKVAITVNKQVIPDDPNPPVNPSGIRVGTPAATTRGMKEADMEKLGHWIVDALKNKDDSSKIAQIREEAGALCKSFSVPGIKESRLMLETTIN